MSRVHAGNSSPLSRSRSPSYSRSRSPPAAAPPAVRMIAASRSVLHAAACSPPVFNSAASGHRAAPLTPPAAPSRTPLTSAGMLTGSRASSAAAAGALRDTATAMLRNNPDSLLRVPDAAQAAPSREKLYASADAVPQVHVTLNGQYVEPGQLLHGSIQATCSLYGLYESRASRGSGARMASPGGPLAALLPPEHAMHNAGAGSPGKVLRADVRPINYSPLNLQRFAQANARHAKRVEANLSQDQRRTLVKH